MVRKGMNKQDAHELSCPICGRIDAKLITGKHHCKKRKHKTNNKWIWPYLNVDMVRESKDRQQPSEAEQLEDGLKQYEQD
jgi:hypothetical protein